MLAPDFAFSSPPDPSPDRDGDFERCWPHAGNGNRFKFVWLIESGDEVIVTYQATRPDGTRFRNTEILGFDSNDKVIRTKVYLGWNLD